MDLVTAEQHGQYDSIANASVVKSRWTCYFLESRSICQKFYFLESKSSFKIFYFLESKK